MTIYNFYFFNRNGKCIYYKEWKREKHSGISDRTEVSLKMTKNDKFVEICQLFVILLQQFVEFSGIQVNVRHAKFAVFVRRTIVDERGVNLETLSNFGQ